MEKATKEKSKKIKVGDVPFEKIVEGLLKVPPKEKKAKKNSNKQNSN